ncbi:phosphotransferase [Microbacterium murale]|uniref:Aminoglycoside phosphotransferase (APT) family kinase protein n=1 Tax=Microbacterium murale TaxID=1081040 RepID=A0ABU0P5R6_9MICO|nr:aminoglycoside phosphotransferase family protein [Microbacterium murale]MDQ0642262.1 aminoglycoside phosphotransferase (APT) family kinase protein [Microbacterium murale]
MSKDAAETELAGGNMNDVTRVDGEVRRPAGVWTGNVHAFLEELHAAGVDGVPRVLGITADGRERLSFIEGEVAHYPLPEWLWNDGILVSSARLLRRIHDAGVESARRSTGWRSPSREPIEVVCHNDFAPYNLVFEHQQLVGVIDFDMAAPGPRLWDLAYLAYRLVPYVEDAEAPADVRAAEPTRLAKLLSAYGTDVSNDSLWTMMAARLDALAEHSRSESIARPELAAHAEMYERDATRLRDRLR